MFDAVRKALVLIGKNGELSKKNFLADVGQGLTDLQMLPAVHHPTMLVLPSLYPASAYSGRPFDTDGMFNFIIHNINASERYLQKYGINTISTISVDTVRYCQMIGKIAHTYITGYLGYGTFTPLLTPFISTDIPFGTKHSSQYNYVGRLWQAMDYPTNNLHEIEVGHIQWQNSTFISARVRLFASFEMPSYHVAVGAL